MEAMNEEAQASAEWAVDAGDSLSTILLAAAKMPEGARSALGMADFYNAAVKDGFDAKAIEAREPINAAGEAKEARIEGFIGSWTYNDLRVQTNGGKGVKALTVRINSPGGLVFSAYGIFDYLRQIERNGGKVTTVVEGRAGSAAALIFMAGSKRAMARDLGALMFHRSMGLFITGAFGNAETLASVDVVKAQANAVNPLKRIDKDIAAMLERRSALDSKAIAKMLKQDAWFDAKEAIESGFATDYVKDAPEAKPKAAKKDPMKGKPEVAEGGTAENKGRHEHERNEAFSRDVVSYFVTGL